MILTCKKDSIRERVHSPDIWCPIGMTQAARKWEQSADHLVDLPKISKWSKSHPKDCHKSRGQLDGIRPPNLQYRFGAEAKRAQQIHKVGRSQV